jgi:hypothetical protein
MIEWELLWGALLLSFDGADKTCWYFRHCGSRSQRLAYGQLMFIKIISTIASTIASLDCLLKNGKLKQSQKAFTDCRYRTLNTNETMNKTAIITRIAYTALMEM